MVASLTYWKNMPDDDFDEDGLTNEKETSVGTGAYTVDTDNDGVTDYAELYITETNPKIPTDTVIGYVKRKNAENGKQVNSPIKVYNVVLWPDDYASRARGGVIRTFEGYKFNKFKGWVQFPEGEYAYKIVNGRHVELEKNEQGYFHIDGGDVSVRLYNEPLETAYKICFIGGGFVRVEDNLLGKALHFMLPNNGSGFITCVKSAVSDFNETTGVGGSASIVTPDKIPLTDARFGRNMNKLSDLADIFAKIDGGECVILSLYSKERGEAFVLAHGYLYRGSIFVADITTGERLGAINFSEHAERLLDKSGELQQYEWFTFEGCGFDSAKGDRIAIVGDTVPSSDN
jgi:hypothetical protein